MNKQAVTQQPNILISPGAGLQSQVLWVRRIAVQGLPGKFTKTVSRTNQHLTDWGYGGVEEPLPGIHRDGFCHIYHSSSFYDATDLLWNFEVYFKYKYSQKNANIFPSLLFPQHI